MKGIEIKNYLEVTPPYFDTTGTFLSRKIYMKQRYMNEGFTACFGQCRVAGGFDWFQQAQKATIKGFETYKAIFFLSYILIIFS
jgi:hypothetical protein